MVVEWLVRNSDEVKGKIDSVLWWATTKGMLDVIKLLVGMGVVDPTMTNSANQTPKMAAKLVSSSSSSSSSSRRRRRRKRRRRERRRGRRSNAAPTNFVFQPSALHALIISDG